MGRQIKRVALDFVWPLDEPWSGYMNPHYDACHKCYECDGSGYSEKAQQIYNEW